MRVDIHAYIGHWPFRQLRGNTCETLLSNMRRYGIDRAAISDRTPLGVLRGLPGGAEAPD